MLSFFIRRTCLAFAVLLVLIFAPPTCAAESRIVALDSGSGWTIGPTAAPHYGLLTREIARQAFLVAARDECGATTRDFWLGDPLPATGDDPPFDLLCSSGDPSNLEIVRGFKPRQRLIWQHELLIPAAFDYPVYVTTMERISRGEFAELFERQGFKRLPAPAAFARGQLPAEVEAWLNEMSFTSQFAALRKLHASNAVGRDTGARLAGLVRCYANLGVMSEYFWTPLHQVFKARALVYAERLVEREKHSPWSLAHRAYARALVGLHGAALADLETTQLDPKADAERLPPWADLIADFCMFNAGAMRDVSDPSLRELAALLRLVMAEQSGVPGLTPRTARQEAAKAPECYRISDGYLLPRNTYNDPDLREEQPASGTTAFANTFYSRLQALAGLPADVQNAIDSHTTNEVPRRQELIEALLAAGKDDSAAEISWPLLGRIVTEISFYEAWREIHPESGDIGQERINELAPLYSHHRYAGFLEMGQSEPTEHRKGYRKLLENIDDAAFEYREWPLYDFLTQKSGELRLNFYQRVKLRTDDTAGELSAQARNMTPENSIPICRSLLAVSPYHPLARSRLIGYAWNDVKKDAVKWERTSATQPAVLLALSKQYAAAKDPAADRLLKAAAEANPTAEYIAAIAAQYAKEGKTAEWLAAMKRLAEMPDVPDRGRIRAAIIDYYLNRGQWQDAREHAEDAIKAGTTDGLIAAAGFYEAQQIWEPAEAQYRKASEEDPAAAFEWYFFCKRTGHGDEAAAHRVAAKYMNDREGLKNQNPQPHLYMQILPGAYYLLLKKPETARQFFEDEFRRNADPYCGMQVALISDRLNEKKLRDQRLAEIGSRYHEWKRLSDDRPHDEIVALAAIFVADLAKKGEGDLDLDAIDKLTGAREMERINCYYFVGEYLRLHGKLEKAVDVWQKCMPRLPMRAVNRTLAGSALFEAGIGPDEYATAVKDRTANPAAHENKK